MTIEALSAITLATHDMARAVAFYRALGFVMHYGGADADFTSFRAGSSYLNLIAMPPERRWSWWGRIIFHVDDVDAVAVLNGISDRTIREVGVRLQRSRSAKLG